MTDDMKPTGFTLGVFGDRVATFEPHDEVEAGIVEMLTTDNARLRTAGGEMAQAALRVVHTHDGLHRLALAVAEWCNAVASEGGRPHLDQNKNGTGMGE